MSVQSHDQTIREHDSGTALAPLMPTDNSANLVNANKQHMDIANLPGPKEANSLLLLLKSMPSLTTLNNVYVSDNRIS